MKVMFIFLLIAALSFQETILKTSFDSMSASKRRSLFLRHPFQYTYLKFMSSKLIYQSARHVAFERTIGFDRNSASETETELFNSVLEIYRNQSGDATYYTPLNMSQWVPQTDKERVFLEKYRNRDGSVAAVNAVREMYSFINNETFKGDQELENDSPKKWNIWRLAGKVLTCKDFSKVVISESKTLHGNITKIYNVGVSVGAAAEFIFIYYSRGIAYDFTTQKYFSTLQYGPQISNKMGISMEITWILADVNRNIPYPPISEGTTFDVELCANDSHIFPFMSFGASISWGFQCDNKGKRLPNMHPRFQVKTKVGMGYGTPSFPVSVGFSRTTTKPIKELCPALNISILDRR